jgi:multiple sugar transport system substrate-binding protein
MVSLHVRHVRHVRERGGAAGQTRRRILGAAGTGLLGAALAGCAGPGQAGEAPARQSGPVTAKVLTFNNPLFQEAREQLEAALAEADPGLKPDIIVFPGQINQFREKAVATYAGGDIPDAQWLHPSITSLMASRRFVRPLDELARKDGETRLADFYPGLLDYYRWRGQSYGLNWYSPGYAFAYNKSLLQRTGVAPPDQLAKQNAWTWEGFVGTLRSLTRGTPGTPDRTIGIQNESTALDWLCAWLWRNGADVFTKDGKKVAMGEPAAIEVIQGIADLYLRYQVVNYGPHAADFPEAFLSGRVGFRQVNKEQVAPKRNDLVRATFDLGLAPVYRGKAGQITRLGTLAFGVAQDGPNGDGGWRWVRFMGGPQAAAVLMAHKSTLPVRPAFAKLPEYQRSMEPWEDADVWLESQAQARALQQPASYQEIATMWSATWDDILAQKGPVKALVDDFVRQANGVLAQE